MRQKCEFAYDDDTSDSEIEDIQSFKNKIHHQNSLKETAQKHESDYDLESDYDQESTQEQESDYDQENSLNEESFEMRDSEITDEYHDRDSKLEAIQRTLQGIQKKESCSSEDEDELASQNMKESYEAGSKEKEKTRDYKCDDKPKTPLILNDDDDDNNLKERMKIRSQLSKMNLEEIQRLKDKIGLKSYHQKFIKHPKPSSRVFARINKNRPREMTSKKTVSRFREIIPVSFESKIEKRDPRFESYSGDFDPKIFKDTYKFLEDIKAEEKTSLQKELLRARSEKNTEEVQKIKYLITRLENQKREKDKCENLKKEKNNIRRKEEFGKAGHYENKARYRSSLLVAKYESLKKTGALDKYMKRKEKKKLAKERKLYKFD